jgi:hypothetical protein
VKVATGLVKKGDAAIVPCPSCRQIKKIPVAQYKEKRKRDLHSKCSCDNIFCLFLEHRKHPRKQVKLLDESINVSQYRVSQAMIIMNISLEGVGFCLFEKRTIQKDEWLPVSFPLNDCNNKPIDTDATVWAASRHHVGCEFKTPEEFRSAFGLYLFS